MTTKTGSESRIARGLEVVPHTSKCCGDRWAIRRSDTQEILATAKSQAIASTMADALEDFFGLSSPPAIAA